MGLQRGVLLGFLLCVPTLLVSQQPSTPSGTPPQTTPSTQEPLPNPILLPRPPAKPAPPPSAIAAGGRVHLDVLVTDAAGKPVTGLEPQNFKILDNNQPEKLLSFRSFDGVSVKPNPPVEVILLFDTANLPFGAVANTRDQVTKFLRQNGGHLAQPVSLMVLSDAGLRIQPRPSTDGNALVSVLETVKGQVQTINPAMGDERALERLQLSLRQMATIADNEARKPGRKLMIWVGPGWPMLDSKNFKFSEKDQKRYFDAIVDLSTNMRQARMTLDSVSLSDSSTAGGRYTMLYQDFLKGVSSPRQADTGNLALKVLATQSGGLILGPDNDLVTQLNRCVAEANAFYVLSFNPPAAVHADEYHDLKVNVDQPGVTARTSSGYYNQPLQENNP